MDNENTASKEASAGEERRAFYNALDRELAPLALLATPIWLFDVEECRWLWGNPPACAIWRGELEEIRAREMRSTQSDAMYAHLNELLVRLEHQPTLHEWHTLEPQGQPQRFYMCHQRFALPDGRFAVLSEAAVEPPAEEIVQLAANTTLTVALYELSGELVSSNPSYKEQFSNAGPELTLASLVPGRPTVWAWSESVETHVPTVTEVQLPTARGQRWFRVEHRRVTSSVKSGRMLCSFFDITESRLERMELKRLARTDALTGLLNRHSVMEVTGRWVEEQRPFSLIYIDLDGMKRVNDVFGHAAGDALLRAAAVRLGATCAGATLGRIGGDEFVVMDASGAVDADEVLRALRQPFSYGGALINSGASVGVARYPEHADAAERLVRCADRAMYAAKQAGRSRVLHYNPDLAARAERAEEIAACFPDALSSGEVTLVIQPIVDLPRRRVVGGECLARWTSPTLGPVSPDEFIPVAEQCDQTQRLALMMADAALKLLQQEDRAGAPSVVLSINLSTRDICDEGLVQSLLSLLEHARDVAPRLCVELTERMDVLGWAQLRKNIERLKQTGCRFGLDDFGAGYSSLTWLEALPVDVLKIDRALVARSGESRGRTMLEMVIGTAATLGIPCVAEGVETEDEACVVTDVGAQFAQGFYFAEPISVSDWRAFREPGGRS